MKPLETLRNEHGLIRQYLDNLEDALRQMREGNRPPKEFFENAVKFGRDFADGYHHPKEELIMFVRLAQKFSGEYDGQIESLRHQHETGRNHISTIEAALVGYEDDSTFRFDEITESLTNYIPMLRDHIHTEDHVFFPLAYQKLSEEEQEQLQVEFDKAKEKSGESIFEESHSLVIEMGSILRHM